MAAFTSYPAGCFAPGQVNDDQYYKLGTRYYATSGAFTQPDALNGGMDDPRTMTAYNYAGGDPINQQDGGGYAFEKVAPLAYECATYGIGGAGAGAAVGTALPVLGTGFGAALGGSWGCITGMVLEGVDNDFTNDVQDFVDSQPWKPKNPFGR